MKNLKDKIVEGFHANVGVASDAQKLKMSKLLESTIDSLKLAMQNAFDENSFSAFDKLKFSADMYKEMDKVTNLNDLKKVVEFLADNPDCTIEAVSTRRDDYVIRSWKINSEFKKMYEFGGANGRLMTAGADSVIRDMLPYIYALVYNKNTKDLKLTKRWDFFVKEIRFVY